MRETPLTIRTFCLMRQRYELIEKRNWIGLAQLFGAAALVSVAGCGGGGGGGEIAAAAPAPASTTGAGSTVPTASAPAATPAAPAPASPPSPSGTASAASAPTLGDCELFPVHAKSAQWIDVVGRSVPFQTDWGVNDNPADYATYWGIPINVVDGTPATSEWPVVSFDLPTSVERGYPDKSDCAVPNASGGFDIARSCGS